MLLDKLPGLADVRGHDDLVRPVIFIPLVRHDPERVTHSQEFSEELNEIFQQAMNSKAKAVFSLSAESESNYFAFD